MTDSYKIAALEKGLRVLACFTPGSGSLGISEISRSTGIPTSTCFRILRTLENSNYVLQLSGGNYAPSAGVLKLGFAALQGNELVEASQTPLRDLHRRTRETCSLAVLSGTDIVYLIRLKSEGYVIRNVVVGSVLPAAITSMGKMLLAGLSDEELERTLASVDFSRSKRGPNATRDIDALRDEVFLAHSRGWAVQDEEVAFGLRSVAVPVADMNGTAGAMGVSLEAAYWSQQAMIDKFLPLLIEAATRASVGMGYLPSATSSHSMEN